MVREKMYNEIQGLKQMGYTIRRCAREIDMDRKTVRKYWHMEADEYTKYMADCRERIKILDPYRNEITDLLERYHNITAAIIHDRLREAHTDFAPSYRSVRLYVAALREELGIPTELKIRQYAEVSELPPGFQAQVDMGQKPMQDMYGKNVKVYIFAMVMSHSRKKFAHFQDHPFNAEEFIAAHDLAFKYFGGRTEEIVYDQDRVMAVSENAGDLILTEAFESYRRYAGFSIRLCRGYDPQSKGKIESVVKYVKGNFLACRIYQGISTLNSDGMAWLDRTANAKIHETTKMIPNVVFAEEIKHLRPVPTLSKPVPPSVAIVRKTNVVHFKQNRYEVPKGTYFPGRGARIEVDESKGTVSFYDAKTDELFATHALRFGVGKFAKLPANMDRYRTNKHDELKAAVLKGFDGIEGAADYIERLIGKYPRYGRDQLRIMESCLRKYGREELQKALDYCVERDLISANDFRDTLIFFRVENEKITPKKMDLPEKYQRVCPKVRSLSKYVQKDGDSHAS